MQQPGRTSRLLAALAMLVVLAASAPATALEGVQAGMKAPDFSLETFDGKTVALASSGQARAILLVFWASWSDKSREVLARVQALHAAQATKGLTVVGINVESLNMKPEELQQARAVAREVGLTFPVGIDRGLTVFGAYGIVAVPSMVLMRADHTVVGDLSAYPIAGREAFFDLVDATLGGRAATQKAAAEGAQPNPRAVRFFSLGRSMVARGLGDQADANLKRAIELDPRFALPRVLLGQVYRERAAGAGAVRFQGAVVQTVHVTAEERERWLGEAERVLEDALKLDAQHVPALTELAAVRLARKDDAGARDLLQKALSVNPSYAPARVRVGALTLRGGDKEGGRREIAAALALNPLEWRLYLVAAQAYDEAGLAADAVTHYRRGVELLWQARREPYSLSPAAKR